MYNKTIELINKSGSFDSLIQTCKIETRNIILPSYEVMFFFSLFNLFLFNVIFHYFVPEKFHIIKGLFDGINLTFLFFAVLKLTGVIL